jgi:hypothetical protein
VECAVCYYQWKDHAHLSKYEKIQSSISNALNRNLEIANNIEHVLFEEPCPNCEVMISKDGGCRHMICGKCRHEFCWYCLTPYDFHHGHKIPCGLRFLMYVLPLILLIFITNFKFMYSFDTLLLIEKTFFYYLSTTLLFDLYLVSFYLYIHILNIQH